MILFRPGQQLKRFSIYRKKTEIDTRGKVIYNSHENLEYIKEKYKWKQIEHTASHVIVVRGKTPIQPEDILVHDGQRYDVESVEEPGEVGIFTVIYCKKRKGLGEYGELQTGNT